MNRRDAVVHFSIIQEVAEQLFDSDSEESESEEENYELLLAFLRKSGNFDKRKVVRISLYHENVILRYNSEQFQSNFRLTKNGLDVLIQYIGPILKRQSNFGRKTVHPEKQLLSTLWLLGTPDSFRSVGDRFDMAKSTLSVVFTRVVKAINSLSKTVIKWPRNNEERVKIQREFGMIAGIPFVLGAVDGTYIPIKAPTIDSEVYVTRKCHYAITLQAICIPSLKFSDAFVGFPGSVSDTRIFRNSDIYKDISENRNNFLPDNTIILGDKAYPILEWCIPPFIDRGNLTAHQKKINKKHAQTRQTIERSFALLFSRFRRLKFLDMNKFEMIPHVVLAACVLHNLCLDQDDLEIEQYINDGREHIQEEIEADVREEVDMEDPDLGRIRGNVLLNEIFNL